MAGEESRWPSVLVLLAHPRPGSFNHALTDRVVTTLRRLPCHVIVHDLYADAGTVQRQHWLQQIGDRSAQLLAADGHPASWGAAERPPFVPVFETAAADYPVPRGRRRSPTSVR